MTANKPHTGYHVDGMAGATAHNLIFVPKKVAHLEALIFTKSSWKDLHVQVSRRMPCVLSSAAKDISALASSIAWTRSC